MRRDLTAAMKARDKPATAALRSTPAAIDNAEAELLNEGVRDAREGYDSDGTRP